jgi:zinc protease
MRPTLHRTALIAIATLSLPFTSSSAWSSPGVPEVRTLQNGLRIVLLEDRSVPYVAVNLMVAAGSKHESDASAGYAHFLERLLQQGTTRSEPREYLRRAAWWGGSMAIVANYDRTSIMVTGVSSALQEMIEATSELAFRATLKDEAIEKEIANLSREMRAHYALPDSVIFLESMRASFPEHPYRQPRYGRVESLGTLKNLSLSAFYRNLYVPNNMVLSVAGDFRPATVMKQIEAAFGAAQRSMTIPSRPEPPAKFAGHIEVEKRLGLKVPRCALTFVTPGYRHPDRAAVEVLLRALGDSHDSPLKTALEHHQLGTLLDISLYEFEDAGMLQITFAPSLPERAYDAALALLEELIAIKRGGLTEAALKQQVDDLLQATRRGAERLPERAERLAEAILYGGLRYYWQLPEVYARLRPADITRVARNYLVADNLRFVILLPEGTAALTETSNKLFHSSLEKIAGPAGAGSGTLAVDMYRPGETSRILPDAWGDWRDADSPAQPARTVLANGVTLIVQQDRRHGLAAASLQLPVGSRNDPEGKEGLASLTLRSLAAGLQRSHSDDPGTVVRLTRDQMELTFPIDPADLRASLQALATTLMAPRPAAEILEPARGAALNEAERHFRDPASVGLELFREKVFSGHPYAHDPAGTQPGLKAITVADLESFRAQHVRPSGAVLALAGDLDPSSLVDIVRALFGDWHNAGGAASPGLIRPGESSGRQTAAAGGRDDAGGEDDSGTGQATVRSRSGAFSRQFGGRQSYVLLGVPGVPLLHDDFPMIRLLGTVLTVNALDELIFARQSAFSARTVPDGFEEGGSLAVEVITPGGQSDAALADLQILMRRLALNDLKDDVIQELGQAMVGNRAAAMQGVLPVASTLAYREVAGLGAESYRLEFVPPEVTAARVRELAVRYFAPDRWITITLGPPTP